MPMYVLCEPCPLFNCTLMSVPFLYWWLEKEKRSRHEQRIREVELSSFVPLVFLPFMLCAVKLRVLGSWPTGIQALPSTRYPNHICDRACENRACGLT